METDPQLNEVQVEEPSARELSRFKTFITIQVIFLLFSPFAGGLRFRPWSSLDSAILVLSIGMSGLAFVLETFKGRRLILNIAAVFYLLGVLDMAMNISLFGVLGQKLYRVLL